MESNECICNVAIRNIEQLIQSILNMNIRSGTGLVSAYTDSGFISSQTNTANSNYTEPSTNSNFIIFLVILGLISYLMNTLQRYNRGITPNMEKKKSIINKDK